MGFGSFKARIKQAVHQAEASVSEAADQAVSAVDRVVDQASAAVADVAADAQAAVTHVVSPWADTISQAAQSSAALLGAGLALRGTAGRAHAPNREGAGEAPAEFEIRLNGQPLDPKHVWVERIEVRRAVNEIPTATVLLTMPQAPHDDYSVLTRLLEQGAIGQSLSMKVGKLLLFAGVVATVQVQVGSTGRRLKVRLKHRLQGLKARQDSRILKQGTDASVLRQVLSEHGVKAQVTIPAAEPVQRMQWNCSDWTFVRAVAGQHGAWLWPQADGGVKVHAPTLGGKMHRIGATAQHPGMSLLDAQWAYSGLTQPQQVHTKSWDLSAQAVVEKTAKTARLGAGGLAPTRIKPLKDTRWLASLTGQWEPAIQQSATDGWLTQQHAQAVRGHWAVAGCQAIELGDTLELAGFGSALDGRAIVTQLEYEIDSTLRVGKTIVGIGLDEAAAVAPSLPAPAELVIGKVAKHQADAKPATWNRVPVMVPMLGPTVLWARMGHTYASTQSGVTFYPEVEDEVVLGFVGQDPVIVASLHNPKQVAPFAPSAKNEKKAIVLRREGKRLEFSLDREQHALQWMVGQDTTPEQQFVMSEEKGLAFAAKQGQVTLEVEVGDVSFTTKKNLKVNATEQVTLEGKAGVIVSSEKHVKLDAQMKLSGQGKQGVAWSSERSRMTMTPDKASVSANEVAVDGTMTTKLSGNEGVQIKGIKVDVKGDAEVSVAGAKVAINGQAQTSVMGAQVSVEGQATTNVGGSGITNVKGAMVNLG
ncbi:hypothetical protein KPG66_10820 [Mycetohabitans sp. B2]|uniref:contractile injection system protein, VgrG/Pvc8 family n=1 Tax=Mycetohabitans sp. B2 TaxID=2841274 RepID=UPI001F1BF7D7|nr:contractile injection system protein, VgrG/Pvc8 family [Mycetohabitans sp. B2]MCF7696564.1 hypothetical protein [Mycetohabitans sp. B2]